MKNTLSETTVPELSVFFPAYNEEQNIEATVIQALDTLKELKINKYEVIVVNDASKDGTAKIVQELIAKNPAVRLVTHKVNGGYGNALKTGFTESKYPWVVFADSDGQFNFHELSKFLEKSDKADLILGYRLNRADPMIRSVLTFGWKTLASVLLGVSVRDYSCGFKMVKKKVFDEVQPLEAEEKVTQLEFLVKAKRQKFKFAEVGVHHYPRRFGNPTGANFRVFIKSLYDLLKLWWNLR